MIITKNYYDHYNTENNKIIIIMATYNRKNGKTPFYLRRSLDSIMNQSNQNWDLIIVGDKFEPYNKSILLYVFNLSSNKSSVLKIYS